MKVEQFPYLSPEASELRQRDGIKPWQIHVCECDAFKQVVVGPKDFANGEAKNFAGQVHLARLLRARIEAEE